MFINLFLAFSYILTLVNGLQSSPEDIIRHYIEEQARSNRHAVHKSCYMEKDAKKCSLHEMTSDDSYLVYPGGNTRCIFSTSTPFAFQVFPGDKDKLLFYFQGGGACWDKFSTDAGLCTTDAVPQSSVGIFDRTNANNAFKSYTIVHVLYCSGDVHGGNTVRPYNDKAGKPVTQVGLLNAQSAVDWVNAQVKSQALASTFQSLVVMGCSAGSLGAQIWSKQLLKSLKWQHAAVVPDSYAGVFPPGSVGPLVYSYGYCSSGFLTPALYDKCMQQKLEIWDINLDSITSNSNTAFAFIQAKTDEVQISFYDSMAISVNATKKTISPSEFYSGVIDIFSKYNSPPKNFITYLIDGSHHCYTNQALYYTTDTKGSSDNGQSTTTTPLSKWLNELPLSTNESIDTKCDGTLQLEYHRDSLASTTYCSSKLVPKTYVQA